MFYPSITESQPACWLQNAAGGFQFTGLWDWIWNFYKVCMVNFSCCLLPGTRHGTGGWHKIEQVSDEMKYVWPTQWPEWRWHFQTHGSMNVYTVWKKLISGCGLEIEVKKKKCFSAWQKSICERGNEATGESWVGGKETAGVIWYRGRESEDFWNVISINGKVSKQCLRAALLADQGPMSGGCVECYELQKKGEWVAHSVCLNYLFKTLESCGGCWVRETQERDLCLDTILIRLHTKELFFLFSQCFLLLVVVLEGNMTSKTRGSLLWWPDSRCYMGVCVNLCTFFSTTFSPSLLRSLLDSYIKFSPVSVCLRCLAIVLGKRVQSHCRAPCRLWSGSHLCLKSIPLKKSWRGDIPGITPPSHSSPHSSPSFSVAPCPIWSNLELKRSEVRAYGDEAMLITWHHIWCVWSVCGHWGWPLWSATNLMVSQVQGDMEQMDREGGEEKKKGHGSALESQEATTTEEKVHLVSGYVLEILSTALNCASLCSHAGWMLIIRYPLPGNFSNNAAFHMHIFGASLSCMLSVTFTIPLIYAWSFFSFEEWFWSSHLEWSNN